MKTLIKTILALACFALLFGLAGREDYRDALLTEMHNNGSYTRLSDAHPELTDAQLADLYESECK